MQIWKRYHFLKAHPCRLSEMFQYLLEQDIIAICQICCNNCTKSNDVYNRMETPKRRHLLAVLNLHNLEASLQLYMEVLQAESR